MIVLDNMFPSNTFINVQNQLLADGVLACKDVQRRACFFWQTASGLDFFNLLFRQFGIIAVFAAFHVYNQFRICMSPVILTCSLWLRAKNPAFQSSASLVSVTRIILRSALIVMAWIHALRVIASMKNKQWGWVFSVGQKPENASSDPERLGLVTQMDDGTVFLRRDYATSPIPALMRFAYGYTAPESSEVFLGELIRDILRLSHFDLLVRSNLAGLAVTRQPVAIVTGI